VFDTGPYNASNPTGTALAPVDDVPNYTGSDPHEAPRAAPLAQQMKSNFMEPNGEITEPGTGPPYFAFNWDGKRGL
jgi:hypothetical protein